MPDATLFAVDDDQAICDALICLADMIGLAVEAYVSPTDFLDAIDGDRPGCVVLDVRMPQMSGLQLQQKLRERQIDLPVIMISGHADVPMAVEAMQQGALTFLEKPFRVQEIVEQVQRGIELDRKRREFRAKADAARIRIARLTSKEQEVMNRMAAGWTNQNMADELGLSLRAIEDRRARLMKKLEVNALRELIALAADARLGYAPLKTCGRGEIFTTTTRRTRRVRNHHPSDVSVVPAWLNSLN